RSEAIELTKGCLRIFGAAQHGGPDTQVLVVEEEGEAVFDGRRAEHPFELGERSVPELAGHRARFIPEQVLWYPRMLQQLLGRLAPLRGDEGQVQAFDAGGRGALQSPPFHRVRFGAFWGNVNESLGVGGLLRGDKGDTQVGAD